MNQSSNYNVWVFRLIYILGICGAIVNFTAEEPQLEIENRRESSPAIYVAELEQELKELLKILISIHFAILLNRNFLNLIDLESSLRM